MPAVSTAQRKAMFAAAEGESKLGIPRAVGKEFIAKDAKGHASGILYVAPDGDVLLLRRASTEKNYGGYWALPGGKAEAGETAEDTAVRESTEELGSAIEGKRRMLDQRITPTGMAFHTFAQAVPKKFWPTLNEEHSGGGWFPLDALPSPMHPGVDATLKDRLLPVAGQDMAPADWEDLRSGFVKWTLEEQKEPAHQAHDARLAFDRTTVRTYTVEGFLRVERTHLSKANICPYLGKEIPNAEELGLDPTKIYKLLRDPDELAKAADTFNNLPLLSRHESVDVDDHQPELIVGSTGTDAVFDAPYLDNSLVVWTKDAIAGIEDETQQELSCGYRYRADMTPGIFGGMPFDGVMRDIKGNHVALVKAGRAGADVVVGDAAPETLKRSIKMKVKPRFLSRQAVLVQGAIIGSLRPKLAQDAQIDIGAALVGVDAKNFKARKPAIIASITKSCEGKLAADADLSDLPELLDAFCDVPVIEGKDSDPAAEPEPVKKGGKREFLEGKLSAEDMKAFDEMEDDEPAGEDEDDETPEEKEKREKAEKEAKDKKARDKKMGRDTGGALQPDKVVTPKAMDAALADQRKSILAEQRAIRDAELTVEPYVGKLAMAHDSAEEVYRTALGAMGVDVSDVHESAALLHILKAQPLPGSETPRASKRMAQDAATAASEFATMFPNVKPLVRS